MSNYHSLFSWYSAFQFLYQNKILVQTITVHVVYIRNYVLFWKCTSSIFWKVMMQTDAEKMSNAIVQAPSMKLCYKSKCFQAIDNNSKWRKNDDHFRFSHHLNNGKCRKIIGFRGNEYISNVFIMGIVTKVLLLLLLHVQAWFLHKFSKRYLNYSFLFLKFYHFCLSQDNWLKQSNNGLQTNRDVTTLPECCVV